jgi:hypothetical protein
MKEVQYAWIVGMSASPGGSEEPQMEESSETWGTPRPF